MVGFGWRSCLRIHGGGKVNVVGPIWVYEHEKWFLQMIKTVFGSKSAMRQILSLKKTVYNSWSEYSKLMHLPFMQLKLFWRHIGKLTKNSLLDIAKKSTKEGQDEASKIKKEVNTYPLQGPLDNASSHPDVFRNVQRSQRQILRM